MKFVLILYLASRFNVTLFLSSSRKNNKGVHEGQPLTHKNDQYLISPCNIIPHAECNKNEGNDHILIELIQFFFSLYCFSLPCLAFQDIDTHHS